MYDWNLNIEKLKKTITKKTKAIIATHIYNYPCRVDIIKRICDQKNILLIEDCAEAIGQKIFNKKCGSFGHISVFSFYANKQITTGEGGMITTNSKLFEKKARSLRNLSFGVKNRFNHTDVAWNYRLTNIQASLGLSQLQRVNTIIKKRHRVGKLYYEKLKIVSITKVKKTLLIVKNWFFIFFKLVSFNLFKYFFNRLFINKLVLFKVLKK